MLQILSFCLLLFNLKSVQEKHIWYCGEEYIFMSEDGLNRVINLTTRSVPSVQQYIWSLILYSFNKLSVRSKNMDNFDYIKQFMQIYSKYNTNNLHYGIIHHVYYSYSLYINSKGKNKCQHWNFQIWKETSKKFLFDSVIQIKEKWPRNKT